MIRRALLLAALLPAPSVAAPPPPEVALIHVEANVGGASGGHVGARLGHFVYHFQVDPDDRLILGRERWRHFRFRYNVLQNRPLHVAHVPLDPAVARPVRDAFAAAHLTVERDLAALDRARRDAELLEALAGRRAGVRLRGAGLLAPTDSPHPLPADVDPRRLAAALARAEAALAPPPATPETWERHRELLEEAAALRALRDGHDLDPSAWTAPAPGAPLSTTEREALAGHRDRLERDIAALLDSPRPDRGRALFTALARQRAVARSLQEGRLRFADPFPDDAPTLSGWRAARRKEELSALSELLWARLEARRRAVLVPGRLGERRYQELESLAARAAEYARGADGFPVREVDERLVPQRGRATAPPPRPRFEPPLGAALGRLEAEEARLDGLYGYALVRDNCVTALVELLNRAPGQGRTAAWTGALEPGEGLGFIPYVFFDQLVERVPEARVETFPAHRTRRVAELRGREPAAWVALREASPLTARAYAPRDPDGSFLLFSDGAWPLRPLQGAFNLGWAALDGAVGIFTAPFDRGARLVRAGKGMLFSFPELVFVNIRKGSYDAATLRATASDPPEIRAPKPLR